MGELTDPWADDSGSGNVPALTVEEYVEHVTQPYPQSVLTSREAAELLGVSEANLRQMVKRGHLSRVGKQGKRSTFDREQVVALKEARGVSRMTTESERYAHAQQSTGMGSGL